MKVEGRLVCHSARARRLGCVGETYQSETSSGLLLPVCCRVYERAYTAQIRGQAATSIMLDNVFHVRAMVTMPLLVVSSL